jgi:hypothetical protein
MDNFIKTNCDPHNILNFSELIEFFLETIIELDPKKAKDTALFILKKFLEAGSVRNINFKFSSNFLNNLMDLLHTGHKPSEDFLIYLINRFEENEDSEFVGLYLCAMLSSAFSGEKESKLFKNVIKNSNVNFTKLMDFIYDKCLPEQIILEEDLGKYLKVTNYKNKLLEYYFDHPSRIPKVDSLNSHGELRTWLEKLLE